MKKFLNYFMVISLVFIFGYLILLSYIYIKLTLINIVFFLFPVLFYLLISIYLLRMLIYFEMISVLEYYLYSIGIPIFICIKLYMIIKDLDYLEKNKLDLSYYKVNISKK